MRKGEELKTPRHASAAASRDDRLPHSRQKDITKSKYLGGLRMSMHYTQACAELTGIKA